MQAMEATTEVHARKTLAQHEELTAHLQREKHSLANWEASLKESDELTGDYMDRLNLRKEMVRHQLIHSISLRLLFN